ncbi:ankyrin repeat-containing domain protein [Kalaharituber pfeilii]|nr:ankyrin repeat-containing domain protein [Kalaharituber pfeilii]
MHARYAFRVLRFGTVVSEEEAEVVWKGLEEAVKRAGEQVVEQEEEEVLVLDDLRVVKGLETLLLWVCAVGRAGGRVGLGSVRELLGMGMLAMRGEWERKVLGRMDINVFDGEGRTPLAWAAWRGDEELVGMLLSEELHGRVAVARGFGSKNRGAVGWAAEPLGWKGTAKGEKDDDGGDDNNGSDTCRHLRVLRSLIRRAQQELGQRTSRWALCDSEGWMPVHYAAWAGWGAGVRSLVEEAGMDPFARTDAGRTVLHVAASRSQLGIAKWVVGWAKVRAEGMPQSEGLQWGIEMVNAEDKEGRTALAFGWRCGDGRDPWAGEGGGEDLKGGGGGTVARWLFRHEWIQLTAGHGWWSPLARAAETGDQESVRYLLQHADAETARTWLTQIDQWGHTPFWLACRNGHRGVIRAIMEHVHAWRPGEDVERVVWDGPPQMPMFSALYAATCMSRSEGETQRRREARRRMRCLETLLAAAPGIVAAHNCRLPLNRSCGPLSLVAAWPVGAPRAAAMLLEHGGGGGGVDVNAGPTPHRTPMCVAMCDAAARGNVDMVRFLLARPELRREEIWKLHPDPHKDRPNPLQAAIQCDHVGVARLLLDQLPEVPAPAAGEHSPGDPRRGRTLVQAARVRSADMVQLLLTHPRAFFDPTAKWYDNRDSTSTHWTALRYAAFEGNYDAFCALLEFARAGVKGSPDSCDRGSALCHAASGGLIEHARWNHDAGKLSKFDGHVRIIRHLLSQLPAGAVDPNCEDGSGETPLYKAAAAGPPVLARALLDAAHGRIDPDKKTSRGDTPLCIAARLDHYEVVEMLLGLPGANPAVAGADGNTPLMWAAMTAAERSLHVLLAHPVARKTAGIPNKGGVTPLSALCSNGIIWPRMGREWYYSIPHARSLRCLQMLLQMAPGVDLRARDEHAFTPLMWAAKAGLVEAMELLCEHARALGQDLAAAELCTGEPLTALMLACQHQRLGAVKWLMRQGAEAQVHGTGLIALTKSWRSQGPCGTRMKLNRLLVCAGADPYWEDDEGVSAVSVFKKLYKHMHVTHAPSMEFPRP